MISESFIAQINNELNLDMNIVHSIFTNSKNTGFKSELIAEMLQSYEEAYLLIIAPIVFSDAEVIKYLMKIITESGVFDHFEEQTDEAKAEISKYIEQWKDGGSPLEAEEYRGVKIAIGLNTDGGYGITIKSLITRRSSQNSLN